MSSKRTRDELDSSPSVRSPLSPDRPNKNRKVRRTGESSTQSLFRQMMLNYYCSGSSRLNESIIEILKSTSFEEADYHHPRGRPVHHYLLDICEHSLQCEMIERRYGVVKGGKVHAFGQNDTFQIGLSPEILEKQNREDYPPTFVQGLQGAQVRMVSAGGLHSAVTTSEGEVYTWGCGDDGTLGRVAESDESQTTPTEVKGFITLAGENRDGTITLVAAGGEGHTLYLSIYGEVFYTGMYKYDSDKFTVDSKDPTGFSSEPVQLMLPKNRKAVDVFAGNSFSCILLDDFSIVTLGFGNCGELGRSADMTKPGKDGTYDLGKSFFYKTVVKDDEEITVLDKDIVKEHFLKPKPPRWNIRSPKEVISAACGGSHLIVVARVPDNQFDLQVFTSGLNNYGQLGHGDCGGSTNRHELTLVEALKDKDIAKVAAGEHFSMVLDVTGIKLYGFGRSDYGQLGIGVERVKNKDGQIAGSFEPLPVSVAFPVDIPVIIKKLTCGERHTMVITIDHEVYTWGFSETGAAGHKTKAGSDVYSPKKLNMSKYAKGGIFQVFDISGGGQHSLTLGKYFKVESKGST